MSEKHYLRFFPGSFHLSVNSNNEIGAKDSKELKYVILKIPFLTINKLVTVILLILKVNIIIILFPHYFSIDFSYNTNISSKVKIV